ncbi:MAG: hypothetical protein ACKO04_02885 [Actinomycetes bacterium]
MDPTTARRIATAAHEGQTDHAGRPYIEHPERVAARLHDPDAQVVALLHDVLEDTDLTAGDLRDAGATPSQLEALEALCHADDVANEDYWASLRQVPLARLVKVADLADNTDPARIALLDPARQDYFRTKYRAAMAVVGWDETPDGEPVRPAAWTEMEQILRPSEPTLGPDVFGDRPTTG